MLYEKRTMDTLNIRIQENMKCLVFGPNGQFLFEEDIFNDGALTEVDCISVLVTADRVEVAKYANSAFAVVQEMEVHNLYQFDTHLRTTLGLQYRLVRSISPTCKQYLYIYYKGILNI